MLVPGNPIVEILNYGVVPFFHSPLSIFVFLHSVNGKCCQALLTTVHAKRSREMENEQEKPKGNWGGAGGEEGAQGAGTPLSGLHQLRFAGRRQRHNRPVLLIIFSPIFLVVFGLFAAFCGFVVLPFLGSKFRLPPPKSPPVFIYL